MARRVSAHDSVARVPRVERHAIVYAPAVEDARVAGDASRDSRYGERRG